MGVLLKETAIEREKLDGVVERKGR
ncbi:uncharacterized protein G2W53_009304 [Senna tora]|uniref:Uncharacterized protein n=1 Tax=Senna tora TaxID=362788 RepID=A0A834WXZ4_9FABA|nr:uncharacterized protein G2W53_009304 [Senna tora]